MKPTSLLFVGLLVTFSVAVAGSPPIVWTVSDNLLNPESVVYCPATGLIYVSSVNGAPTDKDNNGFISSLTPEGKFRDARWATGLSGPKGLRCNDKLLWVADIDTLVSIDLKTGKQVDRVEIKGAKFLNDVALGKGDEVFVSDTITSTIHLVRGKKSTVFKSGPKLLHPNGLYVHDRHLYVAAWGKDMAPDFSTKAPGQPYHLDLGNKKQSAPKGPKGNLDAIELIGKDRWILTDWVAGKVFLWNGKSAEGEVILSGLKGAADAGWVADKHLLIVPEMNANSITAYQMD